MKPIKFSKILVLIQQKLIITILAVNSRVSHRARANVG